MKRNIITFLLITTLLSGMAVIFLPGCTQEEEFNAMYEDNTPTKTANNASMPGQEYVPNEILVKFKPGTSASALTEVISKVKGSVAEKILTHAMKHKGDKEGVILLKTPLAVLTAIEKIKGSAQIEYAEPNYIYTTEAFSDFYDPYYYNGLLWGMYGDATDPANEYGCQAGEAWTTNRGSSTVYVGIIDEGYMYAHEDLAANAGKNPGEIEGDGIDNDDNGYVDDIYGWDFVKKDNTVFDGKSDDHGTHVAGTIGAVGNNGKGVAGVCWNVKLISAKFLGNGGGTTANAIKAVDYLTDLKTRHGIDLVAINNSWGGGGYSQSLYNAIERAKTEGILFIASAGNSGLNIETYPSYPASYTNDNVIAVASITKTGGLSSFSNYGATSVDIGAPGSDIWSTVPQSLKGKIVSSYASYQGTSMAAPHVTGAAALYKAAHPNATASEIKNAILTNAVPTPSLVGKCATEGRLNVSSFK